MMLVAIFLILTVLGILMVQEASCYNKEDRMALAGISGLLLVVCLFVVGVAQIGGPAGIAAYENDKLYVEQVASNPNSTAEERLSALIMARDANKIILENRAYRRNIWAGWFYYKPVGELELIAYPTMPADPKHTITIEGLK